MTGTEQDVGRVALVTGAGRGIGAATVRCLADAGYAVVVLDACAGTGRALPAADAGRLDAVAAPYAGRMLPVVADVRDRAALDEAVAAALVRWGRLDVAVAAAAVMDGGRPLWETDPATLDLLLDVDTRGVWQTAAAAVPVMMASPDPSGCRFVTVASVAGHTGLAGLAAYTVPVEHLDHAPRALRTRPDPTADSRAGKPIMITEAFRGSSRDLVRMAVTISTRRNTAYPGLPVRG